MESLNIFDWVIIALMSASGLYGMVRGFVREFMALAAWIGAYFVARLFANELAVLLEVWVSDNFVRLSIAYVILFIATLVVSGLIISFMQSLVLMSGLKSTDRIFGVAFGLLRGALVVIVLVSLLSLTPVSNDSLWQESLLIPHFVLVDDWTYKITDTVRQAWGTVEPLLPDVGN